jgi:Dolichyl-phosphate-mannose-protein mannosyltransferase
VIRKMTSPSGASLSLRQIGSVLALGLAARLLVVWHVVHNLSGAWFFHRGTEMGFLAQSLLEGKGLSSPFGGATGPTAFIAPGYPVFVSLVFLLFGSYTSTSAVVLMAVNVALNLLSILLILRLALRLSDARTAMLAGGFWAVSLPLIWMPTIFWETSFSCCVVVASLEYALRLESAPSNRGFVLAGASMAIAGLINPALLPMLLAMLLWVAYQSRRARPYGGPLALLTLAIVFSPWPVRNARVFHAFIPLRSTVGFEMWMGNRPQATGYLDESLFPTFNAAELGEYVRVGEVAYVGQKSAEARRYIVSHPAAFLGLSLRRMGRFWMGSGTKGGSPIFMLHACVTSLLGLIGIGLAWRRRPSMVRLSSLALLIFPLPYYMTHAEFRYRLVVDPLLTVFAAYAVTRWSERMARSRDRRGEADAAKNRSSRYA